MLDIDWAGLLGGFSTMRTFIRAPDSAWEYLLLRRDDDYHSAIRRLNRRNLPTATNPRTWVLTALVVSISHATRWSR